MSLRSAAIEAYEATQDEQINAARAALGVVLEPFDVSGLDVEYQDAANNLYVFTDGDVHLAVRGSRVDLVEFTNGPDGAPTVQVQIESLAHLGKVLPQYDPVDENAGPEYPAWDYPVAYSAGDRVTYAGSVWECVTGHTSQATWAPDQPTNLWVKVA